MRRPRHAFRHQESATLLTGRVRAVAALASALALAVSANALADDMAEPQPQYEWREVWGGPDATKDVWLLYTGVTFAPLSNYIYRRPAVPGEQRIWAISLRLPPSRCVDHSVGVCRTTIEVDVTYTDLLIGYHIRLGELTAKALPALLWSRTSSPRSTLPTMCAVLILARVARSSSGLMLGRAAGLPWICFTRAPMRQAQRAGALVGAFCQSFRSVPKHAMTATPKIMLAAAAHSLAIMSGMGAKSRRRLAWQAP
jgi:hypothetical protein